MIITVTTAIPAAIIARLSLPSPLAEAALSCSATLIPKLVAVTTAPTVSVDVTVVVAVVVAVQAVQLVHGAPDVQGPLVHPVQEESGHPFPPHQAVQGPEVQGPEDQLPQFSPPKGPLSLNGPAPFPLAHPLVHELLPLVHDTNEPVNEASGAAVMVVPVVAQREVIF